MNKQMFFRKFGTVTLAVSAATVITLLVPPLGGGGMYFLFLTAIVFSSLYGDFRAGIAATVLSILICVFFVYYDHPNNFSDWLVLPAFALASGFTVFLCYAQVGAETARRKAESRYRAIFEDAITGIYETTLDGRYVTANPKLAQMFGFDSAAGLIAEAENLSSRFYVEPDRREKFIRLVEEKENLVAFESEIYRRDGEKIWISENALAVRDEAGKLVGFQGTTIEITDRKLAESELVKANEELEGKVVERTADLERANEILREEIGERERVEIALRQSEEKFRNLVEAATDWIWETDARGVYVYASPKIKDLIGFEPEEIVGKRPYDLMPPDEAERVKRVVLEMTAAGKGLNLLESVQYHKNGGLVTTETSSVPFYDADGNLRGARGIARDITERKRVENALRESEEKFRTVVEISSDWIWETDEYGVLTYVSPRIKDFLGYEPEEIVGKKPYDLMPPEEAERTKKIFKPMAARRGDLALMENINLHKNGVPLVLESSAVPFYDANGNYLGYRGITRDITDRKRAESMIEASEKRYRELVENANDFIYTADLDGNFTSLNRAGKEFVGATDEQVLTATFSDYFPPEHISVMRRKLDEKLAGEERTIYEIEVVVGNQRLPVEVSSWLIYDENGKPVGTQGIARDLTERKRNEKELLASQKRLRDLSAHLQSVREEERRNLARELHDEFGQSMTALKIELVRLGDRLENFGGGKRAVGRGDNQIPAMIDIVDTAMGTIRKIVLELRPGVLDELGLAAAMEWQTKEFQKRTGIVCDLNIEFEEPAACITLKTTVFRILQECLTNIARHTEAKNVRITLRDEGWRIFFEIEDDGCGIDLARIEASDSHSFGILGMRERALLLDGTVEINRLETDGGSGTRVTVSIPRPAELIKFV